MFTLEEFERMIEAGVFPEDERLELIGGEIVTMPPIGFAHGFGVEHVNRLFSSLVSGRALVWVQSPIQVAPNSRLGPDVALLRPRPDLSPESPPTASDVILVVEVAETSIKYDRSVKGRLYAEAAILEYWIVNLRDDVIEVYTEPSGGSYKQTRKAHRGEMLTLPAELGGSVEVNDILGKTGGPKARPIPSPWILGRSATLKWFSKFCMQARGRDESRPYANVLGEPSRG